MIATLRLADARSIEAHKDDFSSHVRVNMHEGGTMLLITDSWSAAKSIADVMRKAKRSYEADVERAEDLITSIVSEQNSSSADSPAR